MNLAKEHRFDMRGALLLGPMLTAFMILLNEGYTWGATSPAFIATALAGLGLLFFFVKTEARAKAPLLDPRLFRQKTFVTSNAGSLMSYALLFGVMLLMPFVFERGYHDSPLAAGLRLSIIPIAISLVAPVSGILYDRHGPRLPTLCGMLTCLLALVLLYFAIKGTRADLLSVMLAMGVFGVGQGLFTAANNSAIMAAAPQDLTGEAGGLLNVTRAFGMSLGIASASSVLSWILTSRYDPSSSTLRVATADLLDASRSVVLFLMLFAILAAIVSALPTAQRRTPTRTDA